MDLKLGVLGLQTVRVDCGGLVSQMLCTFLESGGKLSSRLGLQNGSVGCSNRIPIFWFPSVEEVDGSEIHVLGVPAEEALPRTEIAIRSIDSR